MAKQKYWTTKIIAKSPLDGQLRNYCGPNIPAETYEQAQEYCEQNGLGYCWVDAQLVCEIPCKPGTLEPDWDKRIDYD